MKEIINKYTWIYKKNSISKNSILLIDKANQIPKSTFKIMSMRFLKHKIGMIGLVTLCILVLMSLIFPLIWTDYKSINIPEKNSNMSSKHFFGTDQYGRDLFTRLWFGLRFSFGLALIASLIDLIVGVSFGIWMAYSKRVDKIIMFIIKVMNNIPSIILLILLVIIVNPSFWIIIFALTITGWTNMSIQIRAQVLRITNEDWVTASKVLGVPERSILSSFTLVILPMIITQLVFTIPNVILSESSLGFIGLSLKDYPTLGNLISDSQENFTIYPEHLLIPVAFLIITVTSIQFIGNGVHDIIKSTR